MEKLTFVLTKNGVFGFIGIEVPSEDKNFVVLKKGTSLNIGQDGVPYLGVDMIPAGYLNKDKDYEIKVPIDNVGYNICLNMDDDHKLCEMYKEFFTQE